MNNIDIEESLFTWKNVPETVSKRYFEEKIKKGLNYSFYEFICEWVKKEEKRRLNK